MTEGRVKDIEALQAPVKGLVPRLYTGFKASGDGIVQLPRDRNRPPFVCFTFIARIGNGFLSLGNLEEKGILIPFYQWDVSRSTPKDGDIMLRCMKGTGDPDQPVAPDRNPKLIVDSRSMKLVGVML